jgi:hypothetical protein
MSETGTRESAAKPQDSGKEITMKTKSFASVCEALNAVFSPPVMLQNRSFTANKVYNRLVRRHFADKDVGGLLDLLRDVEAAMDYMTERKSMAQDVSWCTGFRYQTNALVLFFRFNAGAVRLDLCSVSLSRVTLDMDVELSDWEQTEQTVDQLRKEVDG